ncbi:MAG: hypothetical protein HDQ95_05555 [Roseburia sp.]|nr:hypothetical protein [Roseburia sp.]
MKKIITTVMALTLALGMSVTALADTNPSPSQGEEPVASVVLPVDGVTLTPEEQAIVDAWGDTWNITNQPMSNADAAAVEAVALTGTTDKEAFVIAYGDVDLYNDAIKALVNAGKVTVALSFSLESVAAGDNIVALVFYDGAWHPMDTVVTGDGTFVVNVTHLSPMAIVKVQDKSATAPAAPTDPVTSATYDGWAGVDMAALWAAQTQAGATSPKTGEAGVLGFALIAVACGAALVVTKKKFA